MLESTLESKFTREDYVLRDYLAADRTLLANDRTFLASIRTALTAFVVAATFIKFFNSPLMHFFGWAFIPLGVVALVHGYIRYKKMKGLILAEEQTQQVLESKRASSAVITEKISLKKATPTVRPS